MDTPLSTMTVISSPSSSTIAASSSTLLTTSSGSPTTKQQAETGSPTKDTRPKNTTISQEGDDSVESLTLDDLREAEESLNHLLTNKRKAERKLVDIEAQIYALEGAYLEETSGLGNVIRGFDGYLNSRVWGRRSTGLSARVNENDRLFSRSSSTYLKSLEIRARSGGDFAGVETESYEQASYPAAPTVSSASGHKKKRKRPSSRVKQSAMELDEEDEEE